LIDGKTPFTTAKIPRRSDAPEKIKTIVEDIIVSIWLALLGTITIRKGNNNKVNKNQKSASLKCNLFTPSYSGESSTSSDSTAHWNLFV